LTASADWDLTFGISHPMDLSQECFVKYNFPEGIDITLIDLDKIEGSGMFVDASGANKTFATEQVLVIG